jgi:D-xylose transport system permease protein
MASKSSPSLTSYIAQSFRENIRQYTMFLALILIWVTFGILTDGIFLTPRNLSNLFVQTGTTAILAIGMVLIIVTGNIDLSVGSVLGFCGAIAGILLINHSWGPIPTIAATILSGVLVGAWHGYWVAYRRVPAFIVTLASMLAFRGAIIGVTEGQTIGLEMALNTKNAAAFAELGQGYLATFRPAVEGQIHDTSLYVALAIIALFVMADVRRRLVRQKAGFPVLPLGLQIARLLVVCAVMAVFFGIMTTYLGIPYCILIVLALAALLSFVADKTVFGRRLYAMGGNADAARFSGIDLRRQTLYLFMVTGALVAVAGVIYTARLNAATTSAGQNAELDAIAAAVIGGTSLMGGEGTILGAIVGGLVMTSLDNGMSLMNLDVTYQYVIKGLILLIAVWVDIATRKTRE